MPSQAPTQPAPQPLQYEAAVKACQLDLVTLVDVAPTGNLALGPPKPHQLMQVQQAVRAAGLMPEKRRTIHSCLLRSQEM